MLTPVAMMALYVAHRFAGPAIAWSWAWAWGGVVAVFVGAMIVLHAQDPRKWYQVGPREGERYFQPSLARTSTGNFIPAEVLMMDEYCRSCHPDTYQDWFHSAHRFSSFNNPAYRFSVRETRKVTTERGNPRGARFCAACHDPVPLFSGAFDDPAFNDETHPTATAGVTCTACHAITVDVLVYAHRAVSPRRSSRDCPPKGDARGNLVSERGSQHSPSSPAASRSRPTAARADSPA